MNHPFIAPLHTGVHPPLPTDLTDVERANVLQQLTIQRYSAMAMESCVAKSVLSGGAGFGLGAFFSLMSTSLAYEDPFLRHNTAAGIALSNKEKTVEVFKEMGKNMWRSGKGFGKVGALYAGTECVIESYRAKNDMTNAVAAGFVSGAVLAYGSGPRSALLGGLGFAAFSAAIDLFLRRETKDDD